MLRHDWYLHNRLKLRHLKFLVALDDVRHQAQAAKLLYTTQPGASKMLAELEGMLQTKLFDRTAKGTTPTAEGEILIRHARWILGDLDRIRSELQALAEPLSGNVFVGTNSASAAYLVPQSVIRLRQVAPAVTVSVYEESVESLLPRLENRKLDLIVARLSRSAHVGYSHEKLLDEPMALAVSVNHPLANREDEADWNALRPFPWVVPPPGNPVYEGLDLLFTRFGFEPAIFAASASILHNLVVLQSTDCVTIMPSIIARQYADRGLLAILPIELPSIFGPIGIITLEGLEPTPPVAELIRCLKEAASNSAVK